MENNQTKTSEEEKDSQAWQRAFGTLAEDNPAWDKFTADDYQPSNEGEVLHGEAAAKQGQQILARHMDGEDNVRRAISGRGRPSVGATRADGVSTRLQVLVDAPLLEQITGEASAKGVPLSDVMREAMRFYFTHQTPNQAA